VSGKSPKYTSFTPRKDNASILSLDLTSGSPLCPPLDRKTAITFFPSLEAALRVPPQPSSMSSGCAPTARITSDFKTKNETFNKILKNIDD